MKVAELSGEKLALWAARAAGYKAAIIDSIAGSHCFILPSDEYAHVMAPFRPHEDWAQGGPIIEREELCLDFEGDGWGSYFKADGPDNRMGGPTPLIAAMRAFCASKYGGTVPDE